MIDSIEVRLHHSLSRKTGPQSGFNADLSGFFIKH
jgi:hypothetical protein